MYDCYESCFYPKIEGRIKYIVYISALDELKLDSTKIFPSITPTLVIEAKGEANIRDKSIVRLSPPRYFFPPFHPAKGVRPLIRNAFDRFV